MIRSLVTVLCWKGIRNIITAPRVVRKYLPNVSVSNDRTSHSFTIKTNHIFSIQENTKFLNNLNTPEVVGHYVVSVEF